MKLSVVICTRNRPAPFAATLASLCDVAPPAGDWEVIVVSNDGAAITRDIARASRGRLPLRLVEEPQIGISHARNLGIAEAKGDTIIWTDDDVLYDRDFLRAYEAAIEARPDAVIFGGTVLPILRGNPPAWLKAALPVIECVYSARRPERDLSAIQGGGGINVPAGANFAIRAVQQRQHLYNLELGARADGRIINGEVTPLIEALLSGGHAGIWVPGAIVEHIIPPERQTLAYLRRYYEGNGWRIAQDGRPRSPSRGRRLIYRARMLYYEGLFRTLRVASAPPVWISALRRAATVTGRLRFEEARGDAQAPSTTVRQRSAST
jgi:glucosyl-dolichyl phosphate glucuronosyltransferase